MFPVIYIDTLVGGWFRSKLVNIVSGVPQGSVLGIVIVPSVYLGDISHTVE